MPSHPTLKYIEQNMRRFKVELMKTLQKVPAWAPLSNVAKTLSGRTSAEVIADLNAIVNEHIDKKGINIHKTTTDDLDTYSRDYINEWANELMGVSDRYPLSFYGNREYLPPDISGSYGNSTNPLPYSGVGMLLEDSGTLVQLRPGTDGADRDVYYAYMPNAMTNFGIANWVVTSLPYRPSFIPAGMKVFSILNNSQQTIMGIVCNAVTNVRTGYFIAITNGTFDQTKHSGIFIPNGQFLNITYNITQNQAVACFLQGEYLYVLLSTFTAGTTYARDTCGFVVRRIPIKDLLDGVFRTSEVITGWTINRGSDGQVSRNDLIMADSATQLCTINPTAAYVSQNPRSGTETIWTYPGDDGNQIVSVAYPLFFSGANGNANGNAAFVLTFDFNPVSKVVNVARYFNTKSFVISGASVVTIGGSAAVINVAIRQSFTGRKQACVHVSENKSIWVFDTSNDSNQDMKYTRGLYSSNIPWDSVMSMSVTPAGVASFIGLAAPGGPLGTNFCSLGILSETALTTLSFTKRNSAASPEWAYVRAVLDGSPTYAHKSATGNYAINGYPPTESRAFLGAAGSALSLTNRFAVSVAEVKDAALQVHGGAFHYFGNSMSYWPGMLNRPSSINAAGNGSGSVSIANATMQWIRQQIAQYYDYLGYTTYGPTNSSIMMSVVLPLLNTEVPPFVHGLFITQSGYASWFVFSLYIPPGMSRVNIPDSGDVRIMRPKYEPRPYDPPQYDEEGEEIFEYADDEIPYANPEMLLTGPAPFDGPYRSVTHTPEFGSQCALRKVGDGTVLCLLTYPGFVNSTSGAEGVIHRIHYTPVGRSWNSREIVPFLPTGSPIGMLNFPTKGLWIALSSEGTFANIDYGTKLIGRLWVTNGMPSFTIQAMVDLIAQPNNSGNTILFSQQIPNSWTLFFNKAQPIVLRGISGTLPVYRHLFNAANDSNKTFNVWACSDSPTATPYYTVLPVDQLPFPLDQTETRFFLFLGVVTTNNAGIASIAVGKPASIGPYLISNTKRGSSIPTSAGLPSEPNPLSWR